jgi:hypothetical protein
MSSSGAIRSNTVIDLCHKLDLVPTKSLHIHFVGAEKLEFGNQSQLDIIHLYEPFFQECRRLSVEELHLTFIGPSILPSSSTQASSFVFDGCLNVMVEYIDEVYHNFMDSPKVEKPDLIIMFNAGIWGYSSWKPSIWYCLFGEHLQTLNIPVCFTSYTLSEAEEDFDTVTDIFNENSSGVAIGKTLKWVFECELNPHRGVDVLPRHERIEETGETNRNEMKEYFDSQYWSCLVVEETPPLAPPVENAEVLRTCRLCHQQFSKSDENSCRFHPESYCGETAQRWTAPGDKTIKNDIHNFYSCCGASDINAKGCCSTKHLTYDDEEVSYGKRPGMGYESP